MIQDHGESFLNRWPFTFHYIFVALFMLEIRLMLNASNPRTQPRSAQKPRTPIVSTPPATTTLRMSAASASTASPRTADSESSSEENDEWTDESDAESSDDEEGDEEEDEEGEEKVEEESKESKEVEDWAVGGQKQQHRAQNGTSRTSAFLLDSPVDISRPAAAPEDPAVAMENVSDRSKKRLFSAVTDAVATPGISSPSLRVNAPAGAARSSLVPEFTAKINPEGPVLSTPRLTIAPSIIKVDTSNSTWLTARMEKTGYLKETVQACHNILLMQQGFVQESLFAELTEDEFNTAFLKEIGITGKGTQVYLMRLHRELRAQYFGPVVAASNAATTSEATGLSAQRPRVV